MKDLIVLVADKNMEYAVKGLLGRPQALGICPVDFDLFVHPRRDPGCVGNAHDFLRHFLRDYRYALVLLDHEGSGQEATKPTELAQGVKERLESNGWQDRAEVIVLAPELEMWVWSPSPQVDECLRWAGRSPALRAWLAQEGYWPEGRLKPAHPKEALEAALAEVKLPRSSSVYWELAQRVSLQGHSEPAFQHLTTTLHRWFPA